MSVIHTPWGYTGTVDEIAESKRFAIAAPRFRVASLTDWAPSVSGSVNRTVSVAPGLAVACGVGDSTGVADSVAFDANGGGSNRFDALLATWNWATHTISFGKLNGTTTPPLVNPSATTVDPTKINRIPGVRYDALLGVLKVRPGVGLFSSGDLVDCRMWAGYEGFALTGKFDWLTMLDTQPGSLVQANDTNIVWNRLASNTWGVHKWMGVDKNAQPMLAMSNTTGTIAHNVSTIYNGYNTVVDHSAGLFTNNGAGSIQANFWGKVRAEAILHTVYNADGWQLLQFGVPFGGGHPATAMADARTRTSGFTSSGDIRQSLIVGPMVVQPGDLFNIIAEQINVNSAPTTVATVRLACTYV